MFRYIVPIIMISVSLGIFFAYTDPVYKDVKELRVQVSSYDEALDNSKKLEEAKNALNEQYNAFTDEELTRLRKLLPDNVDNIRLILEIESVAVRYGMTINNVEFDVATRDANGKQIEDFTGREAHVFAIYKRLNSVNQHKMNPIPVCLVPKIFK